MTAVTFAPSTPVRLTPISANGTDTAGHSSVTLGQEDASKVNVTQHATDFIQSHENKIHQGKMVLKLVNADLLNRASTKLGRETEFQGEYKSTKKQVGVAVAGVVGGSFTLGEGSVFVLETGGQAQGCRVEAETVVVAGNFAGEIICTTLEVVPGAVVEGGISYAEICIQRGAKVEAKHRVIG